MDLSTRVHDNLDKIETFIEKRSELMPLEQRRIIKEIKDETQSIYVTAYNEYNEDIELAFSRNFSSMIELQYKTMMFLTV